MSRVYIVIQREYSAGGNAEHVDHAFSNRDAAEACAAQWERASGAGGSALEAEVRELEIEDSW